MEEREVMVEDSVEKFSVDRVGLKCVLHLIQWFKFTFPWWKTTPLSHAKPHPPNELYENS